METKFRSSERLSFGEKRAEGETKKKGVCFFLFFLCFSLGVFFFLGGEVSLPKKVNLFGLSRF